MISLRGGGGRELDIPEGRGVRGLDIPEGGGRGLDISEGRGVRGLDIPEGAWGLEGLISLRGWGG